MAIKNNFSKFGVTFENAYTKIINVEYANSFTEEWVLSEDLTVPPSKVLKKAIKVKFDANTYPSAESQELLNVSTYHVVFPNGDALVESCYSHLKSLPEFDGAIDA